MRKPRAKNVHVQPVYEAGASKRCWNSYRAMINRCERTSAWDYKYYGGRGIKVCKRWSQHRVDRNGFMNFYLDMGNPPEKFSLDRIDSDQGYKPNNCRWTSMRSQVKNRRVDGILETFTPAQIGRQLAELDIQQIAEIFGHAIKKKK